MNTYQYKEADAILFQMEADHARAESKKHLIEFLEHGRITLGEVAMLRRDQDCMEFATTCMFMIREDLLPWLREGK